MSRNTKPGEKNAGSDGQGKKKTYKKKTKRRNRRYQSSFQRRCLQLLKGFLSDKLKIIKVEYQLHYISIYLLCGTVIYLYGNYDVVKRILRNRIFFPLPASVLANLYYFYQLDTETRPPRLIYPGKEELILDEISPQMLEKLKAYLLSKQYTIDVKRLGKP